MSLTFPPPDEEEGPAKLTIAQGPMEKAPVALSWDPQGGLEFKSDVLLFREREGATIDLIGGVHLFFGSVTSLGEAGTVTVVSGGGGMISPSLAEAIAYPPGIVSGANIIVPYVEAAGLAFVPEAQHGWFGSYLSPMFGDYL